jgi:hypothetical protein
VVCVDFPVNQTTSVSCYSSYSPIVDQPPHFEVLLLVVCTGIDRARHSHSCSSTQPDADATCQPPHSTTQTAMPARPPMLMLPLLPVIDCSCTISRIVQRAMHCTVARVTGLQWCSSAARCCSACWGGASIVRSCTPPSRHCSNMPMPCPVYCSTCTVHALQLCCVHTAGLFIAVFRPWCTLF